MSKVLDMPKIRSITYRPDTYNLQTTILSFPDEEKLLEQVDGLLDVSFLWIPLVRILKWNIAHI